MSSILPDSFTQPSVGRQPESLKKSAPHFSFGSSTRDSLRASLGESPGPIYRPETSTVGTKGGYSFGTGPGRNRPQPLLPELSTDVAGRSVGADSFKFPRQHGTRFGVASKGQLKDACVVKYHPTALYGKASPGPAAYTPEVEIIKPHAFSRSFGLKTALAESKCQTPANLGPGSYPVGSAVGSQCLSTKTTLPLWKFGRSRRTSMGKAAESCFDTYIPESSMGKQRTTRTTTAPTYGFGSSTRDQRANTTRVFTSSASTSYTVRLPHPELPIRSEVIRFGCVAN